MGGETSRNGFDILDATDPEIRDWIELEVGSEAFETKLESHGIHDRAKVRKEVIELCSRSWANNEETETEGEEGEVEELVGVNLNTLSFPLLRVRGENDSESFPLSRDHLFRVACAIAIKSEFAGGMQGLVTEPGFQTLGYIDYENYLRVELKLKGDPINRLVNVVPVITIDHKQAIMLQGQLEAFAKGFYQRHNIDFERHYIPLDEVAKFFET